MSRVAITGVLRRRCHGRVFWASRGYTFRRVGAWVALEGSGIPPLLDPRLCRLLAADLCREADAIDAEQQREVS